MNTSLYDICQKSIFTELKHKSAKAVVVTLAEARDNRYGLLTQADAKRTLKELNLGKYATKEALKLTEFLLGDKNKERLPSTITNTDLVTITKFWSSGAKTAIRALIEERRGEEEETLTVDVVNELDTLTDELAEMRSDQRSDERAYQELEAQHRKLNVSYGELKEAVSKMRAKERTLKHMVQTIYKKMQEAKEVSLQEFGLGEYFDR
jgi:hypothetical protein